MKNIQMETLEIILEIIEGKTLSQCSAEHNISASSLSRRIQNAEEELGQKLFIREKQRLVPTVFAGNILPDLKTAAESFARIAEKAEFCKEAAEIIRVEMSVVIGEIFYRLFDELRGHKEYLMLTVREPDGDPERKLILGEADCAFVGNPVQTDQYHFEQLLSDQPGILVSRDHLLAVKSDVSLEDLKGFHVFSGQEAFRYLAENLPEYLPFVDQVIPFSTYRAFADRKEAVFTFQFAASMLKGDQQVFLPARGIPAYRICFCWKEEFDFSPAMLKLIRIVRKHFQEYLSEYVMQTHP